MEIKPPEPEYIGPPAHFTEGSNQPMKTCKECGATKAVADFHPSRAICKACKAEVSRAWKRENKGRHSTVSREWQKRNPDKVLNTKLKRVYGITFEQYIDMLAAQGGSCAICHGQCSSAPRLSVDHCHETGIVRGLLCKKCNTTLGLMSDDPARLIRAAEYLASHQGARLVDSSS